MRRPRPLVVGMLCLGSAGCSAFDLFGGYAEGNPDEEDAFARACQAPGVVRCFGFDSWETMERYYVPPGCCPGGVAGLDTEVKASGAGSLRFDVPAMAGEDMAGHLSLNFSQDEDMPGSHFPSRFGAGQEFFVQWRQRFDAAFLAPPNRGLGWSQAHIGQGDRFGVKAAVGAAPWIALNNSYYRGLPEVDLARGMPVQPPAPQGVYLENVLGCTNYNVQEPPCMLYHADEWMTFRIGVTIGHFNTADSRVRLWLGREGAAPVLVTDVSGLNLITDTADPEEKFGKVVFILNDPGRMPVKANPKASVWIDNLILSTKLVDDFADP